MLYREKPIHLNPAYDIAELHSNGGDNVLSSTEDREQRTALVLAGLHEQTKGFGERCTRVEHDSFHATHATDERRQSTTKRVPRHCDIVPWVNLVNPIIHGKRSIEASMRVPEQNTSVRAQIVKVPNVRPAKTHEYLSVQHTFHDHNVGIRESGPEAKSRERSQPFVSDVRPLEVEVVRSLGMFLWSCSGRVRKGASVKLLAYVRGQ